ncbi:MAG: glutamine-hydrolyzing carbamoyl-phosphate synthase small subunit [Bacteroidetes bacterium]|nr:glutamine-hydrolyzing carbamoyl-phosphate synthase small subunit [Bacteroidota bacterium]
MELALERNAILVLEDGTSYQGYACGKVGTTFGEICFTTGMTGYQELFTDPSYSGQIMITTNVHVGNYGVKNSEAESNRIRIEGLICRNFTNPFSREQADSSIQDYFTDNGLIGITGIDTRSVVRHIRSKGAMNAVISSESMNVQELKGKLKDVPSMAGLELSSGVTTPEIYFMGDKEAAFKVAVLDLGVKTNILRNLADRGCYLKVFPAKTSYEEMASWSPDGYFISNGPGDPHATSYAVDTVKQILEKDHPLFGICLGHQIIAEALGIQTYKMHHGHRGCNHPVINLATGLCEVTTQNHGFVVKKEDLEKSGKAEITHLNLNDETVEGLKVLDKKAFSVQFHPEAAPGPHDSRYLFDQFIEKIKESK